MNQITPRPAKLPPEQDAILERCFHPAGTFVEFKRDDVEQSVPARFEGIARRHPDRLAVKTENGALTYDVLNKAANRVAHAVLAERGGGQEPIGLLLAQDTAMFAAVLGALKADKIVVILDPSLPPARIASILEDAAPDLLVTDGNHLELAKELAPGAFHLLNIDELDAGLSTNNPDLVVAPDHFTYIVYTSGSTGSPKGVVQNHRNGLHEAMLYANGLHLCADDRLALLYSCSASQGLKITFAALLNGAGLYPFDLQREGTGKLGDWLFREEITIYFSIPAVFREFATTLTGHERFPHLRLVQLGSDSVTPREVQEYRKHFAATGALIVRLGSTETGTVARWFFDPQTDFAGKSVPVGYAPEDIELSFLDEKGNPLGFDHVGEIAVTSRYLSPGYWRGEDLTRAKFRPGPDGSDKRVFLTGDLGRMEPNGCLHHLGRKDFQVKVRGQRIEAGDIENLLLEHERIQRAVVVAREDTPGDKRLVGYVVSIRQPPLTLSELRAHLHGKIPDYMIPEAFVFLEALPLTANGKIDRRALPPPDRARPALAQSFVAPRTAAEEALTGIWADVLKLDRVGIHDNFFDLGGHSLSAMQVVSRVRDSLHTEIPLDSLFGSTVAGLADLIEQVMAQTPKAKDPIAARAGSPLAETHRRDTDASQ